MRLTSDIIDRAELESAAFHARAQHHQDIHVHEIAVGRARGKKYGITFYAHSLHGTRATNRGDGERAATWTAWGFLIAELFARDPKAKIGQYENIHDFIATCIFASEARAKYVEQQGKGVNPYADISFLKIVKDLAVVS